MMQCIFGMGWVCPAASLWFCGPDCNVFAEQGGGRTLGLRGPDLVCGPEVARP